MQITEYKKKTKMSSRIPLRQAQVKNKWVTAALVAVYAFIAIFIALNTW